MNLMLILLLLIHLIFGAINSFQIVNLFNGKQYMTFQVFTDLHQIWQLMVIQDGLV